MSRNTQVISSISRKARLNITSVVFIVFIIVSIIVSINPMVTMLSKRNQIASLQNKLNVSRKENIELLALEKSLYETEIVEQEGLKQFNIADAGDKIIYNVNEIDTLKRESSSYGIQSDENAVYSNNNLWENLKILYYKEIYKPDN